MVGILSDLTKKKLTHSYKCGIFSARGFKMKTIIHVNQHIIKRNTKTGESKPCLTVKDYKSNR